VFEVTCHHCSSHYHLSFSTHFSLLLSVFHLEMFAAVVVCTQSHLSDHKSIHSSSRSFICDVCGASFKTKAVQRKHMLTIHTRPGAHVCLVCGRLFNTSFAVKRHSRMHQLQINSVDITAATKPATLYIRSANNH